MTNSPSKKGFSPWTLLGIVIAGGLIMWVGASSIKKQEKDRQ